MSSSDKSNYLQLETQNRLELLRATRRFLAELQSLSTRIATVQEISTEINRSLNLDQILQVVSRQAKWLLDFDYCSICLGKADGSQRMIALSTSSEPLSDSIDAATIEQALRSRQPQLLKDLPIANSSSHNPLRSQLIIPLESEGEMLGTINFALHQPQGYTQEDIRIAYLLALQLAAAIRNAKRFDEMHRLYSELRQAYAELRQLEGLRDELTHMIVHDLRNPLSSILVGLEMIDVLQDNAVEQQRWIEIAQNASDCMNGMIEDLLYLNKLEAGKLKLTLQPIDIALLILNRAESYRAQAETQRKTLLLRLPHGLPTIMVDANLVNRVIDNLVSNALKYTEAGGLIEIGAQLESEGLQVYVRDDGHGVPAEYCDRIFDKFVQVTDPTGATLRKGIGLGLAFCRMAIEAHGGKIWVESVTQRGSTFSFRLPLSHGTPEPPSLFAPQPPIDATNHPITSR
ncbi:GAF domain-containing sensor histidine kinase [Oscillatoria sp. FACHB-1407]|uniref:GAF domain-containing sensor histidine kinase n=1 Tax=Oscillatoria sp. FACHB-1407 TaxID=2692847 RepID=UPI001685D026|nr:GAF domain-containing sensor histidine kinase [Oscillatoria sp. FACHB-1407]MBD2464862.1 GAF domain-containing sensor histidine kinase [Oscillatoria sp. FACHB-1407]